ncbi:hypothetical protein SAMN04488058_1495 [Deinococcus reticulitermitis]|uniref:Uncharacterized protein n=1 Tax=Deinococcus reticulitermitis TaxID=856736 RepID=A0A1H7CYE5_9DEIO|nr:hypothetical protein [Deinococcus reticulitermitis]SEJ94688.1 hypothetical protein SAMN04488058_1495 [Deinococcus reticulitermitis]
MKLDLSGIEAADHRRLKGIAADLADLNMFADHPVFPFRWLVDALPAEKLRALVLDAVRELVDAL